MANGKKTYEIVINGIQQSVDAVESLNKQLDALEKRIDALAKKNVSVSASGGGSNKSALDEEAKILQKIDELHQKVAASEKAEYQELLHAKEELKEYQTIAKSLAAQDNLKSGVNNLNTMQGMKAQLHDLKAAMQTVDINGDQFRQWATEANELTTKLKELEALTGTFSRNVGNYSNGVVDGMKKFNLEVGGVTKEFESAKQALKELKTEMQTLEFKKDQGIISAEESERLKGLIPTVKHLESVVQDAGKPMDALLDTMQSITALASVGQGLSALFGLDESEIEKSIQKLVALQNVLQGLQTIEKQIQAQDGIGSWISKGNAQIDKFAAGLLKAEKNAKLLASGLKMIGGAAIIAGITALVVLFNKFQKSQEEAKKAFERNLDVIKTGAEAYKKAEIELNGYIKKLDEFKGSKKAEKQLIEEVSKKYDIHNKNIKNVKDMKALLIKMAPTYLETIKEEAKMTALAAESAKLYAENIALIAKRNKLQTDYNNLNWNERMSGYGAALKKQLNDINTEIDANTKSMDVFNKELDKSAEIVTKNKKALSEIGVGDGKDREKKVKDNSKKVEEAVRQAENNINELRLRLMRDGLAKELLQLDENNRKEIEKIKKNGVRVQEQIALQEELTAKERLKIWNKYNDEIIESTNQAELKAAQERVDKLTTEIEHISEASEIYFEPASTEDFWLELFPSAKTLKEAKKMAKELVDTYGMIGFGFDDFARMKYGDLEKYAIGDYFKDSLNGKVDNEILEKSLEERFKIIEEYQKKEIREIQKKVKERYEIQRVALNDEKELALKELNERTQNSLIGEDELETLSKENGDYERALETNRNIYQQYLKEKEALQLEYANREIEIDRNTQDDIEKFNTIFYEQSLSALNDYMSKMNVMIDKQPQYNELGFIDLKETKKQYDEVIKTAESSLGYLRFLQQELARDKNVSPTERKSLNKQISDQEKQLSSIINVAKQGMKNAKEDFKKQINDMFQILGQAATQIIQSIGEINQAAFEKEMEALNKRSEYYEDLLEKQKELTQKYADDVNSIEDELATSRGDRRQHLIDQLNAQMQAQRESLAQEKQIEKEQEKLDAKKKKLEEENNKRKKSQAIITAIINAALAISNAAVNNWPIPAIPMIAAATAVGAAQIAAVKAAKYADGGVLQGKSHRQGGIKVLGGSAEVEGGEYITNKRTTAQNVDLLDYINSKKRRVDLSDLIEFYADKPKSIRNITKKYFADGGQLPSLRNDIDINDRMIMAMEAYNERPIVVSVVEIENKMDDVRNVRALAGL